MATVTVTENTIRPIGPTDRWTPLRPHKEQYALWFSAARFVGVPAGRRSGKTELAKRRLVRYLLVKKPWRDPRYFFGGPTHDQAKRIAWQDLLDMIPDYWIIGGKHGRNVSLGEMCIRTRFGSSLYVVGLDQPARIEGVPWDGCVLDESCDLRPGVLDRSVRPALADRQGWCWRIGVPKRAGPAASEFREFCDRCAAGEYQDGAFFRWPSSDILPAAELAQARATMDPKDYREQFEATWETAGGAIFYAFDRDYNVRQCRYDPGKTLIVGSDFNVDPMAWVFGHRYPNRLEWFDEIFLRNTNTAAALAVLYGRYRDHKGGFEFYGDASSKSRKTSASQSDYLQIANHEGLKRLGRTIHYPDGNPPVFDRFASCNAMLCNAAGDRRMFIDPACRHLIDDLEARYYTPGTREVANEQGTDRGHATDAMGYVVHRLFPIKLIPERTVARVISGR